MAFFRVFFAVLGLLGAAACGRQEIPDQVGNDGLVVGNDANVAGNDGLVVGNDGMLTFTCEIADAADTRLSIDGAGKTLWEPGDQILLHGDYTNSSCSATVTLTADNISDDGKKATFTCPSFTVSSHSGTKGYLSTIYAGYPASAVKKNEHCYYYTNFTSTNYPLMAAFNVGNSLKFYNLCGVISFCVSGDFDKYEFVGNNGETVGYTYYRSYLVQKGDESYRLEYNYATDGGTSGPLTSISAPVAADGSKVNYIGIPAGANFSGGFTIRFLKGSSVVNVVSTTKSVNLSRNKLLPLGDITARLSDPGDDPGQGEEVGKLCKEECLGQKPMVIAYLTEYTSKTSLDPTYVTHINYAHGRFVNPTTGDGGLYIEEGSGLMTKVLALKTQKPTLKVLLMIGGWGSKADGFSMMARDADKRTLFCTECKRLIDTYGFDGIDIDWEYPGGGPSTNGKSSSDAANFNLVLKELRQTIGDTKIISFASSSSAGYVSWAGAMEYLDYVNVMTYDMGDPPKHNSPLYKSSTFNQRSCEESINLHKNKGIPLDRMNLGVPFYGHGTDPYADDVKYNEMASILNNNYYASGKVDVTGKNIYRWDDVAKVPYLVDTSGNILLCYDDAESVEWKGKFVREKGLLGAMFWEYRHDDSAGTLRRTLYNAVYNPE